MFPETPILKVLYRPTARQKRCIGIPGSDVVLETKILVLRHLEDQKRLGLEKNLENFKTFSYLLLLNSLAVVN